MGLPENYRTPSKLPDGWVMCTREFYLYGFDNDNPMLFQFDAMEEQASCGAGHEPQMIALAQCRRCKRNIHPDLIREHAHLHLAVELAKAS